MPMSRRIRSDARWMRLELVLRHDLGGRMHQATSEQSVAMLLRS